MQSIDDVLQDKAKALDVSGKINDLELTQKELSRFSKKAKVTRVADGIVFIRTQSGSDASQLRLQQIPIMQAVEQATHLKINKLIIQLK